MKTNKLHLKLQEPKPLGKLLGIELLHKIIMQAQWLEQINQLIQELLPAEARNHCQVVNYQKNIIKLAINNAAWATKIRYLCPQLLTEIKKSTNYPVDAIHVRVWPSF